MWMKRLVTLSSEWKTSEFRQVMIALASGPDSQSAAQSLLCGVTYRGSEGSNR